jgi:hypothetical protein
MKRRRELLSAAGIRASSSPVARGQLLAARPSIRGLSTTLTPRAIDW